MADAAPGYLGRVLDDAGEPVGTCFQVESKILVTAAHVLREVGADTTGVSVQVDPLPGGAPEPATVLKLDPKHDLAVLRRRSSLPASVHSLTRSQSVPAHTKVILTGVSIFVDQQRYRFTHAVGQWLGTAQRTDGAGWGQLAAPAVARGMSGGPVRLAGDDSVVGVLSARYNSADEWMRHTVWVACTEDLAVLLADTASVTVEDLPEPARPAAPAQLSQERLESLLRTRAGGLGVRLASQVKPAELASTRNRLPMEKGEEILAMARSALPRRYFMIAWDLLTRSEGPSDVLALTTHGLRTALSKPAADNRPAWVPYADLPCVRFEVVTKEIKVYFSTGCGGDWATEEIKQSYVVGDGFRSRLAGVGPGRLDNWRRFVAEITNRP